MSTDSGSDQRRDRKAGKAILVVGMHRSGTSALTRVLNLLGADLPMNVEGPGVGNEIGHWEPKSAVQLHREMLADAGSTTNSPINFAPAWFDGRSAAVFAERIAALVGEEYGSSRFFVMKEPRATLFVPTWIAALDRLGIEPHFVIPFRHPLEVARSLTARQQTVVPHSIWPAARGVALWMRYVLAAEKYTRGHRRSFVSFDALLSDWKSELARIARQLDVAWPNKPALAAAEIDTFLNARHRHQSAALDEPLNGFPPAVASVYAALHQAAADPKAQTESFDRAAADIAAGEALLAPYVARMEAKIDELSGSSVARKIVTISGAPSAPAHMFRVDHYAASARRLGHHVTAMSAKDAAARITEIDGADLVVLWRCAWNESIEQIIQRARATGAKIIVDVDDRIFEPDVSTPRVKDALAGDELDAASVQSRFAFIEKTISHADLCTAATQGVINQLRPFGKPLLHLRSGFDEQTCTGAQLAAEARRRGPRNTIRIGYAGGAKGLAAAIPALVRLLGKYRNTSLVLLGETLALEQFPTLKPFADRIEQRGDEPLAGLPQEFGRLDIVIAGSGSRQRLAGANDEISFFCAALARVPTVGFASEFFATEITPGVTGLLAQDVEELFDRIGALVDDERLRSTIGENAQHDVLWRYGPDGRDHGLATVLDYLFSSERQAAEAFRKHIEGLRRPVFVRPPMPESDIVFESARKTASPVAVAIPLYNYAQYIEETLESVKNQTFGPIDLVVVDDCSTDDSLAIARRWMEKNQSRFAHLALLRNKNNASLGPTRNAAFAFTSARYVMALDADNVLLPACLERCCATLESSGAAAAFPISKQFGNAEGLVSNHAWQGARLACSNYIDAMAMIRKSAWAACGGYASLPNREDYELWMKFIERGFWAAQVPEVLALYRVHSASLVNTYTAQDMIKSGLWNALAKSHPWIAVPTSWSQSDES